jgi:hypothetical protein
MAKRSKLLLNLSIVGAIILGVFLFNSFSQPGSYAGDESIINKKSHIDSEPNKSKEPPVFTAEVKKHEITKAIPTRPTAVKEPSVKVKTTTSSVSQKTYTTPKTMTTKKIATTPKTTTTSKTNTITTKKSDKDSIEKQEVSYKVISQKTTDKETQLNVQVSNPISNKDLIQVAHKVNDTTKNQTTVQFSVDATVTLNNKTRTGELNRNYTYSESQVEYGKVNYEVVGADVKNNKAKLDVIAQSNDSKSMYDVSKEISTLVKESNEGITQTDIYYYNNHQDVQTGNYKWKYSDSSPNKITQHETFQY